MRLRLSVWAALAAASVAVPASAAQSVDEIVARHIAARGGTEKIRAINTLKITRTVATGIGSQVRVVIHRKRPQLFKAEQQSAAPGAPVTMRGVNAEAAWDTVAGGKIVTRPEAAAAEARELDGDFDGLLVDWKEKGHTVAYEGKEMLPGAATHKLKVTTKSGAVRIIYLDATTYLDRRHSGVLNLPGGRQFDVTIDFDNWREVNGVKFPFDINEERTGKEPVVSLVTYTEKIEANVPLDDAFFATPVGK